MLYHDGAIAGTSRSHEAGEQGDEADEAFGGARVRTASMACVKAPPNARADATGRGHRFAAYPRCSADLLRKERDGL
jgi:hypothetical protein